MSETIVRNRAEADGEVADAAVDLFETAMSDDFTAEVVWTTAVNLLAHICHERGADPEAEIARFGHSVRRIYTNAAGGGEA